jgi:hypothetical protein
VYCASTVAIRAPSQRKWRCCSSRGRPSSFQPSWDPERTSLDYVPHGPLGVDREHGTRIGRALAEIHRRRFTQSGFLGADLQVCTPFIDTLEALRSYARAELDRAALPAGSDLRSQVLACLADRLDALRAAAESPVLLHADFKASNLHWTLDNRLLVLDWEFAYSGPALMDVGQLLRWDPPATFVSAFAESYRAEGGELPDVGRDPPKSSTLFNLVGLLGGAAPDSRRSLDVRRRMMKRWSGGKPGAEVESAAGPQGIWSAKTRVPAFA